MELRYALGFAPWTQYLGGQDEEPHFTEKEREEPKEGQSLDCVDGTASKDWVLIPGKWGGRKGGTWRRLQTDGPFIGANPKVFVICFYFA